MAQSNKINFKGQKIYIGIDVHLKTWHVTVMTAAGFKRKHSQPASSAMLFEHLKNNYPGGEYHAIYESGFAVFSTYYELVSLGIECTIAHAADIPTGQNESVQKTDAVDSEKLARVLKNGDLRNKVYVPHKDTLDDRGLVRHRTILQKMLSGWKSRVKHLLHSNGVKIPDCFDRKSTHWSRKFMQWLRDDVVLLSSTRHTLDWQLEHVESMRKEVLAITREIRSLARTEKYDGSMTLLMSVPGIGIITAINLLVELENIERFRGQRAFANYLGLVPTCSNTGEKKVTGEMTFRGNRRLRTMLVESSWIAISRDRALAAVYGEFCARMSPQKAIIRIARKLSNRIFSVLKYGKIYENDRCE